MPIVAAAADTPSNTSLVACPSNDVPLVAAANLIKPSVVDTTSKPNLFAISLVYCIDSPTF